MNIIINGIEYKFEEEVTVLSACQAIGIDIPTLCNDIQTENHGHCRLCYVEINGKLQLACETYISNKMQVITDSKQVIETRKLVLSLLIKEHYFNCPLCDKSAKCEFQKIATQYDIQMSDNFVCAIESQHVDFTDDLIYDESKCITCGKCIRRISDYNVPNPAVFIKHKLKPTKAYKAAELIDICPTAALKEKYG